MSDEQKSIKGKLLQELLWSPLTWLPLIPAAGVYAFVDMPGWVSLLGFGLVNILIIVFNSSSNGGSKPLAQGQLINF